jgi:hypothetical protein
MLTLINSLHYNLAIILPLTILFILLPLLLPKHRVLLPLTTLLLLPTLLTNVQNAQIHHLFHIRTLSTNIQHTIPNRLLPNHLRPRTTQLPSIFYSSITIARFWLGFAESTEFRKVLDSGFHGRHFFLVLVFDYWEEGRRVFVGLGVDLGRLVDQSSDTLVWHV